MPTLAASAFSCSSSACAALRLASRAATSALVFVLAALDDVLAVSLVDAASLLAAGSELEESLEAGVVGAGVAVAAAAFAASNCAVNSWTFFSAS